MAKARKFGTFGGVFVPSVLTILGVIMYLRLGWVVGNAGLVGTIIIILIAHIISVCTGLSVSSIATDKKVKAGGIYYILSRSLGLPIGGAIGIALFVATALSIAMYIVGFGESFNSAIGFSQPGMEAAERINNLRITGSITLIAVTTIALVSTSLAIKAQYYILAAIVLSLISILAGGMFMDHGLTPSSIQLFSGERSVSMETVFAIFFPAVTGFTAGVAMSGDLKDPKKSIPVGTMSAITVGLVVYIGLAIFLSITIDPNVLMDDTNILAKIALLSAYGAPFLMAGIWGATLSSALGGILGGPRILQAMSVDKVTPKLFGKGVGKSNEPRNALLFTFIIAEAGILIGELDLIAPIVSMFYLAAYGFINLTSALESWSGSDFKPTFKIPRAISIIGALATFAVMFKLDMIAMFASFIVIGMIFLFLTKKQINLGFSDVWHGVWSEVVRTALSRMNQKAGDKRSWRPNIILFSGSTDKRPYLLEYGKRLVGRLGLLSNFDLVEDQTSQVLLARHDPDVENADSTKGLFTRQFSCNDIYSGIERIAETYGFSGLEPNTVLIGWARYTKDPLRFSRLINRFQELDYNLLIMDYDQRVGFGDKKRIDIWWEGQGRHISVALTISRFLSTSDDWQEAVIRLYIVADTSQVDDLLIFKILEQVQEDLRVTASVKIINSALDHRTFYEMVRSESSGADLIYLELPELKAGSEAEFFKKTDALCQEIGTVILYRASKEFETIDLGLGKPSVSRSFTKEIEEDLSLVASLPALKLPVQPIMADNFQTLNSIIQRLIESYYQEFLQPFARKHFQLVKSVQGLASETYDSLLTGHTVNDVDFGKTLGQKQGVLLEAVLRLIEEFQAHDLKSQEQSLLGSAEYFNKEINTIIGKCPPHLLVEYPVDTISSEQYKQFNWRQRLSSKVLKRPLVYHFEFQKLTTLQLKQNIQTSFLEIQKQINRDSDHFGSDLQKYIRRTAAGLQTLKTERGNNSSVKIAEEVAQIDKRFQDLKLKVRSRILAYRDYLLADNLMHLQKFVQDANQVVINKEVRSRYRSRKHWDQLQLQIKDAAAAWGYNQPLYFNFHQMELRLLAVQNDLYQRIDSLTIALDQLPREMILQKIDQLMINLKRLRSKFETNKHAELNITHDITDFSILTEKVKDFIAGSKELTAYLPVQIQVPNVQNPPEDHSEEVDAIEISPRDVVNYLIQTNLIAPLEEHTRQLQPMLSKVDHTVVDVLQVIKFTLGNVEAERDTDAEKLSAKVIQVMDDEVARLEENRQKVEDLIHQLREGLKNNYKVVAEKLNAYAIIKSAVDLDYYLRTQKQTQVLNKFSVYSRNFINYVQTGLTSLYYRRSEGLIVAKRYQSQKWDARTWNNSISRLINTTVPEPQVLEDLPFYYKQLFLRPHSVNKELWLIREHDSLESASSIQHYRKVRSGALLIIGAPLSGKTYLSEFIGKDFQGNDSIYQITPPEEGTVDLRVFHQSIKKSIKFYGNLESAFEKIKEDSVMIFNDVELWWGRHQGGFKVLEALLELIDSYGNKCLFILNMNTHSYHLINAIKRIEDSFFKILKIPPFNAQELKHVILSRHTTSRLKFEIEGKPEDSLSKWNQAKLFTKYFDTAQGNVGVALQQWIKHIQSISDSGEIQIRYPGQPDLEVLSHIDKDRAILLIQFILHKRLSLERLELILNAPPADLDKQLQVLKRLDVLREKNGVWEINRYLQPFLIARFEEDHLI